ncbi:MAG: ABC transporter permease subunit [Candidatus Sericytochromatia bacterium]
MLLNNKLLKYVLYDLLRSKVMLAYGLLLMALTLSVSALSGDRAQIAISLLNLVLLLVPLISLIFSTMYSYQLRDFLDLLLAQPVSRRGVFLGQYLGISSSLALAFLAGCGGPLLVGGLTEPLIWILIVGVMLNFIFTGFGFLAVNWQPDKIRGMATSLFIWFYTALLFDALILFGLVALQDYPLEKPALILSFLNPVDLARILVLIKLDISALMGYTGALYRQLFGSGWGQLLACAVLLVWAIGPVLLALKLFEKRDC